MKRSILPRIPAWAIIVIIPLAVIAYIFMSDFISLHYGEDIINRRVNKYAAALEKTLPEQIANYDESIISSEVTVSVEKLSTGDHMIKYIIKPVVSVTVAPEAFGYTGMAGCVYTMRLYEGIRDIWYELAGIYCHDYVEGNTKQHASWKLIHTKADNFIRFELTPEYSVSDGELSYSISKFNTNLIFSDAPDTIECSNGKTYYRGYYYENLYVHTNIDYWTEMSEVRRLARVDEEKRRQLDEESRKRWEIEKRAEETRKREEREKREAARSYSSSSYSSLNPYASYDDGYDDVMNGDYDDYRYKHDSEYEMGVDDALDELEERGEYW